jgi:hypothetical protein
MAQLVKLKRTSVEGRKPTTSNLSLGELAINTHDGKIYFEKDNGSPSIREIATEDSYYFYTSSYDSRYVNLTGNESIGGNKTFSNNVIISGDLSVEGTTTTIDSTTVNIGDNTLELNYGGSQTSGGILVKDATGSSTVSGSLLWDSTNDYWKLGKLASEARVIVGNGTDTAGKITKFSSDGVITDSIISENGTTVTISNDLVTSGDITASGDIRTGQYIRKTDDATYPYINFASEYEIRFGLVNSEFVTIGAARIKVGSETVNSGMGGFSTIENDALSLSGPTPSINLWTNGYTSGGTAPITWYAHTPGEPDTQMYNDDGGNFIIRHNERPFSGEKFKIDSDGAITFNGAYKFPTTDGSSNQVLKTDGSGAITFGDIGISEVATVSDTFTNATSKTVTHNFGTKNVIVSVYDDNDGYFLPSSIITTDTNTVTVTFVGTESGRVVVAKGGHVVQGTAADANLLDGQDGTYYLNYGNFTSVPSGVVSGSAQLLNVATDFGSGRVSGEYFGDVAGTTYFTGSFIGDGTALSGVTSYTDSDNTDHLNSLGVISGSLVTQLPSGIVSGSTQLANTSVSNESLNAFTQSAITVSGNGVSGSLSVFSDTHTVVNSQITSLDSGTTLTHSNNGNIIFTVSGSNGELLTVTDSNAGNLLEINDTSGIDVFTVSSSGDATFTGEIIGSISATNGVISGSAQITDLTTHKETVSGASSYIVDHNLNEQYPIVQAWNTTTSQQELPQSITTNSVNRVTVVFSTTFAGIIIVKK